MSKSSSSLFEAIENYINNYPLQLQISCHNGRTAAQEKLDNTIKTHGIKSVDGAWECIMNTDVISTKGHRLGDLGSHFHKRFNSKLSLFIQNGSTMGNQIVALVLAHKKILIQSNSHVSVYTGLSLAQAEIILVEPQFDKVYGYHMAITADQISKSLQQHPDIYAVYLTSPSYEGLVADYEQIRKVIGNRILIVDEAHGAIHYFSDKLPKTALACGADISISSMHKSLGTLVGTSLLNLGKNSRISQQAILDSYYVFATTSPNLILIASVFDAVTSLDQKGDELVNKSLELSISLKEGLAKIPNIFIDQSKDIQRDPMKIIFGIKTLTGKKLASILSESYQIEIEKYTFQCVVVTLHINSLIQDIEKVIQSVTKIANKYERIDSPLIIQQDEPLYVKLTQKRKIHQNLTRIMAAEKEEKCIGDCLGRISGSLYYTCPPGYPIIIFGEEILDEHIQIFGKDYKIQVIVQDRQII